MIFILKNCNCKIHLLEKLKQSCLACYSLWRKTVHVKFVVSLRFVKLQQIGYRPIENLWIIMMVWMSKSLSLWKRVNSLSGRWSQISYIDVLNCFILSFQMWRVVCFMHNCNKLVLFLITRYRYIFTAWMTKLVHALWYVRAQPGSIRQL